MGSYITLTVPLRPEFLGVLRTVTTGAAGLTNLPYDAVDDLSIAVDEAASMLLSADPGASTLSVRIELSGSEVEVVVFSDGATQAWPPPGIEDAMAWRILDTLTDSLELAVSPDGPQVRLRKRIPELA